MDSKSNALRKDAIVVLGMHRSGVSTVAKVLAPADLEKVRNLVKNDSHLDDTAVRDEAIANNQDHLNQTPTIVIVVKGKREVISGGMPYTILRQYLNQKLGQ